MGLDEVFDHEWKRRALRGERGAVEQLAEHALDPLYRFCFYRVGCSHEMCEEAVQQTMATAIARLDRYEPDRAGGQIGGWLTGLARNEIRSVLAARPGAGALGRMWDRLDDRLQAAYDRLESHPLDDEVLRREETGRLVNLTMAQLPDHYRSVLEDKYVEGCSVREMAQRRTTSEKAVESLLSRARRAFREAFKLFSEQMNAAPDWDGSTR